MSCLHKYKQRHTQVDPRTSSDATLVVLFSHMRAKEWKLVKQALWTIHPDIRLRTPTTKTQTAGAVIQGGVRVLQCPHMGHLGQASAYLQTLPQALVLGGLQGIQDFDVYDLAYTTKLCGSSEDPLGSVMSRFVAQLQSASSLCQVMTQSQTSLLAMSSKK